MNLINEVIICNSCKGKLKDPVFLPCGHSICKHHVEEMEENNNKRRKIECKNCSETHEIPNNGFVPNRTLEHLMKIKIDKLDLGEEYNSAFDKFSRFKDLLENFNNVKSNPEMKIHTVLSNIRNKVDLRREELKQEIDNEALKLIEKIDKFEKECKSTSIKSDSNLDKKIGKWKNEVEESQLVLNTLERNTKKWNEISNKMTSHLKELQSEFINFNENLFLNRLNEFIYSDLKLTNDFYVTGFEVKEWSRYGNTKEINKKLVHHVFKAFGIEWILSVYIKPAELKDSTFVCMAIYLSDARANKSQSYKIGFDLVILDKLNMAYTIVQNRKQLKSESCFGFFDYNVLNDLLNNYNLYNIEKDSFMLQFIIKKFEWL